MSLSDAQRAATLKKDNERLYGILEQVREFEKTHVGQWIPGAEPNTFDRGVGAAAHDILVILDPVLDDLDARRKNGEKLPNGTRVRLLKGSRSVGDLVSHRPESRRAFGIRFDFELPIKSDGVTFYTRDEFEVVR